MNRRPSPRTAPWQNFCRALSGLPDLPALLIATFTVAWCVSLWLARQWFTGSDQYFYLVYNLALAAIPLLLGTLAIRLSRERPRTAWMILLMWLVFFPNAPYLLTDLIHLRPQMECPFWFDWLLFVSMAGAGLLLGLTSLAQVHQHLRNHISARAASVCIALVVALSSFGIYLGRFLRWNSWDLLARPGHLLEELADMAFHPLDHPRMLAYCFGVAVLLGLSYFGPLVIFRCLHLPGPEKKAQPES